MSNTQIIEHKSTSTMMMDPHAIESYKSMAQMMAQSKVQVPDHFKGKPADCLAVVLQAAQWQMNPFVVAQKTHVINGTLGYEAQLVNAVVSSSNVIQGRFHYEYKGTREEWKARWSKQKRNGKDVWVPEFSPNACVRVGARLAGEEEITWGEWIYPCDQQVFNSPLWRTNARQQAGYLAVKFWARFYTPDVLLGAYTPDELHEAGTMKDINPAPSQQGSGSKLLDKLKGNVVPDEPEAPESDETETQGEDITEGEIVEPEPTSDAELASEASCQEWKTAIEAVDNPQALGKMANDIVTSSILLDAHKQPLLDLVRAQKQKLTEDKANV